MGAQSWLLSSLGVTLVVTLPSLSAAEPQAKVLQSALEYRCQIMTKCSLHECVLSQSSLHDSSPLLSLQDLYLHQLNWVVQLMVSERTRREHGQNSCTNGHTHLTQSHCELIDWFSCQQSRAAAPKNV